MGGANGKKSIIRSFVTFIVLKIMKLTDEMDLTRSTYELDEICTHTYSWEI
jgi:hypothetical protein